MLRSVVYAIHYLTGLLRDNGWPCAVSKELGRFRGPGRKEDSCPFSNLATLKAFVEFEELRDGPACHVGAETLLALWSESLTRHHLAGVAHHRESGRPLA